MEVISSIESLPKFNRENAITIGNFDGIHVGHRKLIATVVDEARKVSGQSVVMTFNPHPMSVLFPDRPVKAISSTKQMVEIIKMMGVDVFLSIPFTDQFARQTPEAFIYETLLPLFKPSCVVVGKDHRFGCDRRGDSALLHRLLAPHGIDIIVVDPVYDQGEPISSSRIRDFIKIGDLASVTRLLGRYFRLNGVVRPGWGRGRDLGYATANMLPSDQVIPSAGIYASRTIVDDQLLLSMTYIGTSPSFTSQAFTVETHIFDYSSDLVGKDIDVEFVERIRDDVKFHSTEDLIKQIKLDEVQIRKILANLS